MSGRRVQVAATEPPGVLHVAALLVAVRWRLVRGGLRVGPRLAALRFAALFALLVPAAYTALFANSLAVLRPQSEPAAVALLWLVVGLLVASGFLTKLSTGDLVRGHGGEIELLLAQPVSLSTLVVARAVAGPATDIAGALFLFPALTAGALAFDRGPGSVVMAAAASALIQVAVNAAAQTAQIVVVQTLAPRLRRIVFVAGALAAAGCLAAIWVVSTRALRDPVAASTLASLPGLLLAPGAFISAVVVTSGTTITAAGPITTLIFITATVVVAAGAVARWASHRGWEQASVESGFAAGPALRRPEDPLSLTGKDWRLLLRDRTRIVSLLALPLLFVGMQLFGSAGWEWTSASSQRMAVCAYSLAAYAATFGPLIHLEAERRAFWIVRATPVSVARLFAAKAGFWSALLTGFAGLVYLGLCALSDLPVDAAMVLDGVTIVVGTAVIAWLAVGLGVAHADLSDEARPAVGIGTAYLFMLLAGLFNLAIVATADRPRVFALFVVASAVAFWSGVAHARQLYDAEALRRPRVSPLFGMLAATFLVLGARAVGLITNAIGPHAAEAFGRGWTAFVGSVALAHGASQSTRFRRLRAPVRAAVFALITLGAVWLTTSNALAGVEAPWLWIVVTEICVRGLLQQGLHELCDAETSTGRSPRLGRVAPVVVSAIVAGLLDAGAGANRLSGAGLLGGESGLVAAAILPAIGFSLAKRWGLPVAIFVRVAVEALRG